MLKLLFLGFIVSWLFSGDKDSYDDGYSDGYEDGYTNRDYED